MPKKTTLKINWLQSTAVRVTRWHFIFIAAYMVSIVVFDSWNLITHEAVADRWTLAVIMLIINTVLWYLARMKFSTNSFYIMIVLGLVLVDIVFASLNVYWQRGLASKSVALFAVPLVAAATLRSRTTLLATASLCVAGYSLAAVRYFYEHYGESFKVELYGEIVFYSAIFFVLAGLLWILIRPEQDKL